MDQLVSEDPKKIIDYINNLKSEQGIDFIKIRFRVPVPGYNKTIINNYYRNINNTFVEFMDINETEAKDLLLNLKNISNEKAETNMTDMINRNVKNIDKVYINANLEYIEVTVIKEYKSLYNLFKDESNIKVTYKGYKESKKIIKG